MAVKALWKACIDNGLHLSQWWGEVMVLRRLKHDNIIELLDEVEDDNMHCLVLPLYTVTTHNYN